MASQLPNARLGPERIAAVKEFVSRNHLPKHRDIKGLGSAKLLFLSPSKIENLHDGKEHKDFVGQFMNLNPKASRGDVQEGYEIWIRRVAVRKHFPRIPQNEIDTIKLPDDKEAAIQELLKVCSSVEAETFWRSEEKKLHGSKAADKQLETSLPIRTSAGTEKVAEPAVQNLTQGQAVETTGFSLNLFKLALPIPSSAEIGSEFAEMHSEVVVTPQLTLSVQITSMETVLPTKKYLKLALLPQPSSAQAAKMETAKSTTEKLSKEGKFVAQTSAPIKFGLPVPESSLCIANDKLVGMFGVWLRFTKEMKGMLQDVENIKRAMLDILSESSKNQLPEKSELRTVESDLQHALYEICKLVCSPKILERASSPPTQPVVPPTSPQIASTSHHKDLEIMGKAIAKFKAYTSTNPTDMGSSESVIAFQEQADLLRASTSAVTSKNAMAKSTIEKAIDDEAQLIPMSKSLVSVEAIEGFLAGTGMFEGVPEVVPPPDLATEQIITLVRGAMENRYRELGEYDIDAKEELDDAVNSMLKALADARKNPVPVTSEWLSPENKLRRALVKFMAFWSHNMQQEESRTAGDTETADSAEEFPHGAQASLPIRSRTSVQGAETAESTGH